MKIFVIRNEEDKTRKNLAYLIYYEKDKRFYIELPDDADIWETPLILSSRLKRGEMHTGVKSGYSRGLSLRTGKISEES